MYDDRDTMQLDMRRMNAIEIDEKNGIAIVEPYVIHAQRTPRPSSAVGHATS